MMNSIEGNALVTGGGTGIGAAIATALADDGIHVTIAGRRMSQLETICPTNSNISPIQADVSGEASVEQLFAAMAEHNRSPSIVIANAGIVASALIGRTDMDLWQQALATNLTGTFLTFREALAPMELAAPGRLIAIASTVALKGYSYVSAYCAAKHGVVGLVRALAQELSRTKETVNAICSGFADTPMLERSVNRIAAQT